MSKLERGWPTVLNELYQNARTGAKVFNARSAHDHRIAIPVKIKPNPANIVNIVNYYRFYEALGELHPIPDGIVEWAATLIPIDQIEKMIQSHDDLLAQKGACSRESIFFPYHPESVKYGPESVRDGKSCGRDMSKLAKVKPIDLEEDKVRSHRDIAKKWMQESEESAEEARAMADFAAAQEVKDSKKETTIGEKDAEDKGDIVEDASIEEAEDMNRAVADEVSEELEHGNETVSGGRSKTIDLSKLKHSPFVGAGKKSQEMRKAMLAHMAEVDKQMPKGGARPRKIPPPRGKSIGLTPIVPDPVASVQVPVVKKNMGIRKAATISYKK